MRLMAPFGSLPPETRREQASLFNSSEDGEHGEDGCGVLVASDAIGMCAAAASPSTLQP